MRHFAREFQQRWLRTQDQVDVFAVAVARAVAFLLVLASTVASALLW